MERIDYLGLESFACPAARQFNALKRGEQEAFLDLIEDTASTTEGLCYSVHILFIGRKTQ